MGKDAIQSGLNNEPLDSPIRCIDLFCGAGGLTHGFELAGLQVTAGIDLDPACRYPYEKNNRAIFIERSVSDLRAADLKRYFGDADTRVLAGCAPCQPFSSYTQGKNSEMDHKYGLLYEFRRLAKLIRPQIITMENVPSVRHHAVFSDFVDTLRLLKYEIWQDVVECAEYGVPQTRRRLVLLASQLGPIEMIQGARRKRKTVKQAIGRLRRIDAGEQPFRDRLHVSASMSKLNMKRIRASKPGGSWKDWPDSLVANCHKSATGKSYSAVYGRMEWDKPSPTITTQCYGFGSGRFGHPEQNRAISLREAALLQGFPRGYEFVPKEEAVRFTTVGRLIGNAVPVGLGRAIAQSILKHVGAET